MREKVGHMSITKEEMAARINLREYGEELNDSDKRDAKDSGLLVVYGASDDLVEFDGLFTDEVGAWNGAELKIDRKGVLRDWENVSDDESEAEDYFARKGSTKDLEAVWGADKAAWTFKTDIPNAKFTINDEGSVFCIGIVIDGKDL